MNFLVYGCLSPFPFVGCCAYLPCKAVRCSHGNSPSPKQTITALYYVGAGLSIDSVASQQPTEMDDFNNQKCALIKLIVLI